MEKIKKEDTDEHAERHMKGNHRVPDWMCITRLTTLNYLSHRPAGYEAAVREI